MNHRFASVLVFTGFVISFFSTALAAPRQWKKLEIPGARCADGSPYYAFLDVRDPTRLAIDLMGGGACWSHATCFGPTKMSFTEVFRRPPTLPGGVESTNPAESPLAEHSMLYLPYCSGDVFVSARDLRFKTGARVQQYGALNIDRSLDVLRYRERFPLAGVKELVVYGASAGALGAVLNISKFDALVPPDANRVLISDSPGLHFGESFWDRYDAGFREDVAWAMEREGMRFPQDTNPIASQLASYCTKHADWRIAFLQGESDVAMSALFGRVNPREHKFLVYGAHGLLATIRNASENCTAWIHPSPMHTYGLMGASARFKVAGRTAMEFIAENIRREGAKTYAPEGR